MNNTWYELEIMPLTESGFYKDIFNSSDENAGFDLYSSDDVTVQQEPKFIPFGITANAWWYIK
jgi:hypothetical protein